MLSTSIKIPIPYSHQNKNTPVRASFRGHLCVYVAVSLYLLVLPPPLALHSENTSILNGISSRFDLGSDQGSIQILDPPRPLPSLGKFVSTKNDLSSIESRKNGVSIAEFYFFKFVSIKKKYFWLLPPFDKTP